MMSKNQKLLVGLLIALVFVTIGGVYLKIAKDEIFYLCGNFSAGVDKSSVIRQLETANLSNYKHTNHDQGSNIVLSSKLFFVTNQCIIELDTRDKVVSATYQ
ncbi:hypothetical protein FE810_13135 [Thalassotalea litorea]|uniref:Uncharacterized protein n=1 Tax=Thalassotalea litorea TaxID=2020715 RepID=A0A5R9IEH7_9GAMM|nr:hypothetical protein [Thalassotalea litorea]TLU61995.1 hypothetical protein FE810_13135 [Thalassotalea litorea]